jgi:hypothetical protein
MRLKRNIADLEVKQAFVKFPVANCKFERFTERLREVINQNCGCQIARSLEYDEYEEAYRVTVTKRGRPGGLVGLEVDDVDDFSITLEKCVLIKPEEPLSPQIDNIIEVREHLHKRYLSMCVALDVDNDSFGPSNESLAS